jgi:hypothetical protein
VVISHRSEAELFVTETLADEILNVKGGNALLSHIKHRTPVWSCAVTAESSTTSIFFNKIKVTPLRMKTP